MHHCHYHSGTPDKPPFDRRIDSGQLYDTGVYIGGGVSGVVIIVIIICLAVFINRRR